MNDGITIRRAETLDDYRACQEAQRRAWGIGEDGYLVPVATMVGAQLHGGLVLGAFLPGGEAVGLSFAFLGRVEGRLGLYSQLTGVVPGYQDRGIGGRLKHAQRAIARDEGLALIAWAFDPLQAGNARFNLDKLGAVAVRYIENMYGPRTDALNAGTPTDRLIVAWETAPPPRPALSSEDARSLPRILHADPGGVAFHETSDAPALLLEIPTDINRLRASDPALADRWRLAIRRGFQSAFAAGYRAVGFVRLEDEGQPRGFYRLERESSRHGSTNADRM